MKNAKYGDEGFTTLFKEEIKKDSSALDFLGDLKEVKAYIRLLMNFINPFTFYFINDTLTNILKHLDSIEIDYNNNENNLYQVQYVIDLDKKVEELKLKVNNYIVSEEAVNKISALSEVIYTKCLRLERDYYKSNKTFKFQSYLNRLNDYFYYLKDYANKEM